jgi:hypothetical protein
MPLVKGLENALPPREKAPKVKRVVSIIIVFIIFIAVMILFTVYIGSALGAASTVLLEKAPEFISKGLEQFGGWLKMFKGGLPQAIAGQFETFVSGLGPAAGKFLQDFVVGSMAIIPSTMPTIIGFFTLPFFLFFVLMDYESFKKFFFRLPSCQRCMAYRRYTEHHRECNGPIYTFNYCVEHNSRRHGVCGPADIEHRAYTCAGGVDCAYPVYPYSWPCYFGFDHTDYHSCPAAAYGGLGITDIDSCSGDTK